MKIAVIGRTIYTKLLKKILKKDFIIKQFSGFTHLNKEKFKDIDILISMTWGKSIWGEDLKVDIPKTEKLKLIHLPGSGTDGIDFSKVPSGCLVCNVYEHEIAISEFIIANLLNWEIKLFDKIKKFKNYNWNDSMLFSNNPHGELNNKKIAILGYGRIGRELAKKLTIFKSHITIITRKKIKKDKVFDKNLIISKIKKNIKEFDYFIIACDLNHSTFNLITEKEINLMNKNCVIVNIARGPIINESDLYYALKNKLIGGAVIDTWYRYPGQSDKENFKPSRFNFGKLDNIVMTPHLSALSSNLLERRINVISKNIMALKKNKKLINVVHEAK